MYLAVQRYIGRDISVPILCQARNWAVWSSSPKQGHCFRKRAAVCVCAVCTYSRPLTPRHYIKDNAAMILQIHNQLSSSLVCKRQDISNERLSRLCRPPSKQAGPLQQLWTGHQRRTCWKHAATLRTGEFPNGLQPHGSSPLSDS